MDWVVLTFRVGGGWMLALGGILFLVLALGARLSWRLHRLGRRSGAEAREEEADLRKALRGITRLGHLAGLAMMLGVLGSVRGMIVGFSAVSCCDAQAKAALLARGISEALTLTASGLGIALLALALQGWLRARAASGRVELHPPEVAPGAPALWLTAPAACLLPSLVVFLFMGSSFEPPVGALPAGMDTEACSSPADPIRAAPSGGPVLAVTPGGVQLEMTDGWRLELPAGEGGFPALAQALAVERNLAAADCQGSRGLLLVPRDDTTLEQIVALMDTCRSQGYTHLLLAARE